MRIGVPRAWFTESLDPEVAEAISKVIDEYKAQGAEIVDVELPNAGLGVSVYYVVACAEATCRVLTVCVTGIAPRTTAIFRT